MYNNVEDFLLRDPFTTSSTWQHDFLIFLFFKTHTGNKVHFVTTRFFFLCKKLKGENKNYFYSTVVNWGDVKITKLLLTDSEKI